MHIEYYNVVKFHSVVGTYEVVGYDGDTVIVRHRTWGKGETQSHFRSNVKETRIKKRLIFKLPWQQRFST